MELELEAKKKASENQSRAESGQEFFDSELEPEDMASELERLMGLHNTQQVSLEDALKELS